VTIVAENGARSDFDAAVIATHADEALRLLGDASPDEKRLLGAWTYTKNVAVLHTDRSVMPRRQAAWASWNYTVKDAAADQIVAVSYHMNRLQSLKTKTDYFVTLNPGFPIAQDSVIREIQYTHPRYTFESLRTQAGLVELNGKNKTYFCGSYFYNGFHEDAVKSAVNVALQFGAVL
jgi:predicted NAD/FAD-binding protein